MSACRAVIPDRQEIVLGDGAFSHKAPLLHVCQTKILRHAVRQAWVDERRVCRAGIAIELKTISKRISSRKSRPWIGDGYWRGYSEIAYERLNGAEGKKACHRELHRVNTISTTQYGFPR